MRIVLAEDSALVREGVAAILSRFGHEVVEASDADGLTAAVEAAHLSGVPPDLVLTDVRMPPTGTDDGLRAAIRIREEYPGQSIVVLSQYVAAAYARELIQDAASTGDCGGLGYLLKDRIGRVSDFLASLDVVASGGIVIDPEVVRRLAPSEDVGPTGRLTPREREVLALMAEGKSNAQLAAGLFLSDAAVSKHIGNIFAKLGLDPADGHRRVRAVLVFLRS